MSKKPLLIAGVVIFLLFAFVTPLGAVDSRAIEAVRAKKVLDNADLKTIDAFVAQAIGEILNTTDFTSISNSRSIIIANSASNEAGQVQFAEQFSESVKKHAGAALEEGNALTQPGRRFKVVTNLLMVIDVLADPHLVELPLKYVDSNSAVISYWAVHCLTNSEIIEKLSSPKELDTVRQIISRLGAAVPSANAETLGLITSFVGSPKVHDADELLFKVADRRIDSYADWSVEYERIDAAILQLLGDRMDASNPNKAAAGKRFGQLLSYVFQRYAKGTDRLNSTQKTQLASVLIEVEKTSLSKLAGKPLSDIKKAIESADQGLLLQQHNTLLGDGSKAGSLNIDYGAATVHPLQLSVPPAQD